MSCNYCKELEKSLINSASLLRGVHEIVGLYITKTPYSRFLQELEEKQGKFLYLLSNLQTETNKVKLFEKEVEICAEGTLNLIWKDQCKNCLDKINSLKKDL